MLIKFFRGKHNNVMHAFNYLLDKKRVKNGTAKLLNNYNNVEEFKLFYKNLNKNKYKSNLYTSGVISFDKDESKKITNEQIEQIIDEFLGTLMPGIPHHNYLKSFIKHTDKGRIEVHFVIGNFIFNDKNIKKKTAYLHKADFKKFEIFERYINKKYKLNDPEVKHDINSISYDNVDINMLLSKKKTKKEIKEEIHNHLIKMIYKRKINNRNELIEYLKSKNIKINRTGKDYITIIIKDKKIRLKGDIYSENFTSVLNLENVNIKEKKEIKDKNYENDLVKILEYQTKQNAKNFSFIFKTEEKKEKKDFKLKGKKMYINNEEREFLKRNLLIKDYLNVKNNNIVSPLRADDLQPSFFVTEFNTWIDYGTGERGDVFDLISRLEGIDNFYEVLKRAKKIYSELYNDNMQTKNITQQTTQPKQVKQEKAQPKQVKRESNLIILSENNLSDKNLINYFTKNRGIDESILKQELKELKIYNKKTNKTFKVAGFKNNSGGYELRNKLFKGSLGKKDITFVNKNEPGTLLLEGFTDYLSLLTMFKYKHRNTFFNDIFKALNNLNVIILNSVANLAKAKQHLDKSFYIVTMLDSDKAGEQATKQIKKDFSNKDIIDFGEMLKSNNVKDINELLLLFKNNKLQQKNELTTDSGIILGY